MLQVNPDTPKHETSDSLPPVLDFDEKRRKQGVRIFKYLSWIGGLVAVSVFIVAYTAGAPLTTGFELIIAMVAAYLVLPLTIDRFRSPDTIITVALIWLVALLTVATVYYGGFTAAALPWYCAIPIFAYYYLSGWRLVSVLVAVGAGFAVVSLLVALGIVSREMAVANSTDADYGIAFGFLLIYISVASYLFRKGEQEARVAFNTALDGAVEARQKADEASAAKSKFLKSMSHELRTPLNALVGFSDVMRRMTVSPDNNAKFNMYSEDMFSSAKHLSKLVDDVLNYTALGSGAFKVQSARVDLMRVAESCVRMIEVQPDSNGKTISCAYSDGPVILDSDERLLMQIVLNVLTNAANFTPDGGLISVVVGSPDGQHGVLSVADTGIGISAKDLPRITEPFYRVSDDLSDGRGNLGLGLAITSDLVDVLGGTLSIDSELGTGTTVTCSFPLASTAPAKGV